MKLFNKNQVFSSVLITTILVSLIVSLFSSFLFSYDIKKEISEIEVNSNKYDSSENFVCIMNGKEYLAKYITQDDVEVMKTSIDLREPDKNYNQIIDGHGTGLTPPTKEDLEKLIGKISIIGTLSKSETQAPEAVQDLSTDVSFPAVGDQGAQGSCAAWALTYYSYGYLEAKDHGWNASSGNPDYLMSPAWTFNKVTTTSGSWMTDNAQIIVDWGCATMSAMPYDDSDVNSWGNETAWREAPYHRAYDYYLINFNEFNPNLTIDVIKSMIIGGSPVTFTLHSSQFDSESFDGNWIISSSEYDSTELDHAQTIVGFDDSKSEDGDIGAFRVVNSWGTGFAEGGYYWLTYETLKEIGFVLGDFGLHLCVIEDRIDYLPSLIANWEFDPAPTRMNNLVKLGVGPHSTPLATKTPWYYYDGVYLLPEFMTLDISEFHPYYDADNCVYFFLDVGSSTTTGTISSFKVERYNISGALEEITSECPMIPMPTPGYVQATFMDINHEVGVKLDVQNFPKFGIPYQINSTVINNGLNNESTVDLFLYLDGLTVFSTTILNLTVGNSVTISYNWTPSEYGLFNFTAYIPPIPDEKFLDNNNFTKMIFLYELKNYTMKTGFSYNWIDASEGTELFLLDDGSSTASLPFNFQFYNRSFSTIYISANGYLSFIDNTPYNWINVPFPSTVSDNSYMIAPFWDDLNPTLTGHIYVKSFDNFWVIEWVNISRYGGPLVGSFEVILYQTGEIIFNYDYIDYISGGYTCGLNFGLDVQYYNSYQGLDNSTEDFSILFAYNMTPNSFDLTTDADTPTDDDGIFDLEWTESFKANNYSVYQYSKYITEINESLTILIEDTTDLQLHLDEYSDGTYYFIVVAKNNYGETKSNCIEVIISIPLPPEPFTLDTDADTPYDNDGAFNLSWTVSNGVNYYNVYQYSEYITEINISLTLITEEITDQELALSSYENGRYYFIVVASNDVGETLSNCILVIVRYGGSGGGIPGYELLFIIGALGISLIILKKRISKKIKNNY